MPVVSLKAHFNGKQIVLDEPFDLPPDSPLMVTVSPREESVEDSQWRDLAASGLAKLTWGRQVRENPLHLTPYDYI
jgi:hypothetical protein